jgi:hypothetical protein
MESEPLSEYAEYAVRLYPYAYALDNPLGFGDPNGYSPYSLVKLIPRAGTRFVRWLTRQQAIEAFLRELDVKASSLREARKLGKDISKACGGGGKVTHPEIHGPGESHIHALGPGGERLPGHIFVEEVLLSILDSNGNGEILDAEDVFDLLNPIPGVKYSDYFPKEKVNPYCPYCL